MEESRLQPLKKPLQKMEDFSCLEKFEEVFENEIVLINKK